MNLELIASPAFWGLAVAAVFLTGLSKGGMGGGAGIATPLIALAVSPVQAAAVMLPVLCVMDVFGIRAYLWRWDPQLLRRVVIAGLLGCAIGALTFRHMNEHWIRILLGVIALGFLAYSLLPRKGAGTRPSGASGWFWATLSGFTSFITHSGGPPLMVYLVRLRLDKAAFVATSLVFFAAMNYSKVVPYFWLGLFDARNLGSSVLLIPVGVAGISAGVWLQKRMDTRWFYRLVYTLLAVTGTKLLYDGTAGLLLYGGAAASQQP